jgi:hypothetical protein
MIIAPRVYFFCGNEHGNLQEDIIARKLGRNALCTRRQLSACSVFAAMMLRQHLRPAGEVVVGEA